MPKTQKHVLRIRFKLSVGSKKLDVPKALQLVFALVDGAGATIKLSPNVRSQLLALGSVTFTNDVFHFEQAKHSATKRRLKIKQAAEALASAKEDVSPIISHLLLDCLPNLVHSFHFPVRRRSLVARLS